MSAKSVLCTHKASCYIAMASVVGPVCEPCARLAVEIAGAVIRNLPKKGKRRWKK